MAYLFKYVLRISRKDDKKISQKSSDLDFVNTLLAINDETNEKVLNIYSSLESKEFTILKLSKEGSKSKLRFLVKPPLLDFSQPKTSKELAQARAELKDDGYTEVSVNRMENKA